MEQVRIDPAQVVGWGVDADPENDPTYPMRDVSSDDNGGLNWERPSLQPESVEVLMSTEHNRRPAVFGTSTPPAGISGMLRRHAFKRSEGKWGHWLMLLMADRVDMVEGIVDDLGKGRIPNVPAEMGIRSEIRHNLPGLTRKVVFTGAVLGLTMAALRTFSESRERRRAAEERVSHLRERDWRD